VKESVEKCCKKGGGVERDPPIVGGGATGSIALSTTNKHILTTEERTVQKTVSLSSIGRVIKEEWRESGETSHYLSTAIKWEMRCGLNANELLALTYTWETIYT